MWQHERELLPVPNTEPITMSTRLPCFPSKLRGKFDYKLEFDGATPPPNDAQKKDIEKFVRFILKHKKIVEIQKMRLDGWIPVPYGILGSLNKKYVIEIKEWKPQAQDAPQMNKMQASSTNPSAKTNTRSSEEQNINTDRSNVWAGSGPAVPSGSVKRVKEVSFQYAVRNRDKSISKKISSIVE